MAKLQMPLLSMNARGKLGDSIVYFPWKGIRAARIYVIPANPRTNAQSVQRSYFSQAVADVHSYASADVDVSAFRLKASLAPTPWTWFNEAVRQDVSHRISGHLPNFVRFYSQEYNSGTKKLKIHTRDFDIEGEWRGRLRLSPSGAVVMSTLNVHESGGSYFEFSDVDSPYCFYFDIINESGDSYPVCGLYEIKSA